jgi:hypothetical protein
MDQFTPAEVELMKNIAEVYQYLKELLIYSEELELDTFLPAINEIRDAFDHMMRVFAVRFEIKKEDNGYEMRNLNASFRHIYRATFELLDYIRICQKMWVDKTLNGISPQTLVAVFPEYYKEIKPEIDRALEDLPRYREKKDIGDPKIDDIKNYVSYVRKIQSYFKRINQNLPALYAYEYTKR